MLLSFRHRSVRVIPTGVHGAQRPRIPSLALTGRGRRGASGEGPNFQVACSVSNQRLTCDGSRVVCLEIRVGKAGARPALPRNCKARFYSPSQATSRIDGAANTFAGEGGSRSRDVSDASAAFQRGGAPSLLACSIRETWAGRHWKTGKTNRNPRTIGRARDHIALDRMPHRLPCRSRLIRLQSRLASTSHQRSRSRIAIGSSPTWSMCATDLRAARCAPVLPRRSPRRFARTLGRC